GSLYPNPSSGKRSEPRYLGCYVSWVGSWPQCASRSWRVEVLHEPPPLVAADVRRLTLSKRVIREKDQSLVTSAPTLDWLGFKAPMRVRNSEVMFHFACSMKA